MAEKAVHWKKDGTPGFLATAAGMATAAAIGNGVKRKLAAREIQIFVRETFR
jgi:hypothetical protein